MFEYLRRNPALYLSEVKEPQFLSTDMGAHKSVGSIEDYLNLFAPAPPGTQAGEASVYYLASRVAPGAIKRLNPNARIVVMLRNPVDQMYSNHRINLQLHVEDLFDFEQALNAEPDRRRGERSAPWVEVGHVHKLFYRETANYAPQVRRYFEVFGRERVHVIIYSDFKRSPRDAYFGVCDFLGVQRHDPGEFERINESVEWRSPLFTRILRVLVRRPPLLRPIARVLMPRGVREGLMNQLFRIGRVSRPPVPLDDKTKQRLQHEIRGETDELCELLGRDLRWWYKGTKAETRSEAEST